MSQGDAQRRAAGRYVAAGATYLVLSGVLFLLWLAMNTFVVLLLSVPTLVGGLVLLSVGWPRLTRARVHDHRTVPR